MSVYYPILLNIEGKRCVIVGGGQVAGRKALALLEAGASVSIVSPEISGEAKTLAGKGNVEWIGEAFSPERLDNAALVIASTGSEAVNRKVHEEAVARNVPVNVVDRPELCEFIVPSVIRRGDLVIAVSTSGKSPALSKRIRKELDAQFGMEWAEFLEIMGEAREKALAAVPGQKRREELFNRLAGSRMLELIRDGDLEGARGIAKEILES